MGTYGSAGRWCDKAVPRGLSRLPPLLRVPQDRLSPLSQGGVDLGPEEAMRPRLLT